LVTFCVRTAC